MILKLLKPYGISPIGTILPSVAVPVADLLIQRKVAVVVGKKKSKVKGPNHGK